MAAKKENNPFEALENQMRHSKVKKLFPSEDDINRAVRSEGRGKKKR